ncbi:MAG: exodeoxyribonuclease III [Gammaproteobacteria bacterium]|nr:exodeoxyribonuclease III [Gammaproteobacteria bacterium]
MRIITLNCNGIRAAARKGLFDWLPKQNADVICLQEVRAPQDVVSEASFQMPGYSCHYLCAERKGYSGVALFSRRQPDAVIEGLGWTDLDPEARYLEARYPGLSVVSVYIPSGSSKDERQQVKMSFLDRFLAHLKTLRRKRREYVLCGDWNIAHKEIDLKNWRSNQKNSGFLPEERAWMDQLFGPAGFVDAFRVINKDADQYTWWSNRGQAWAKNVGWRIDYQVVTPKLEVCVKSAQIYTAERFSDHAPLIMDYETEL